MSSSDFQNTLCGQLDACFTEPANTKPCPSKMCIFPINKSQRKGMVLSRPLGKTYCSRAQDTKVGCKAGVTCAKPWNNQSDRIEAAGNGVDIKHNSYARRLLKLKAPYFQNNFVT